MSTENDDSEYEDEEDALSDIAKTDGIDSLPIDHSYTGANW